MIYRRNRTIFSYDPRSRARSAGTVRSHSTETIQSIEDIRCLVEIISVRSCDVTSQSVFHQSNDRVAKGISIVDRRMIPLNKTLPRDLCPKESRETRPMTRMISSSHIAVFHPDRTYFLRRRAQYVLLSRLRLEGRQAQTREQRVAMEPVWWPLTWQAQEM